MHRATLSIAGTPHEFFATGDGFIFESVVNGSCPQIGRWPHWGTRRAPRTLETALLQMLPETHECAQCKRGDNKGSHAFGYFVGRMPITRRGGADGWAPYRGWLCDDHAELLHEDGYELKQIDLSN